MVFILIGQVGNGSEFVRTKPV